ncbi:hypothetical protein HCC05_06740 [Streptococcus suis]|uniref:Uncharacterized protein n=1 Tax=Streptococcus suis TaxID=1307 RepID=A0A0Z8BKC9_STRSU|nr:hypothetical protein [Streptococcus suis]MCB2853005.1 hypothetical protein [Streptococcus suis]MCB2854191.1 hypothetical protein [Streptococcus suis]MCB2865226.1 hypothetical protein [Streptococcus suis]MCB2873535.1 hypothetical protein [Streptococcus suis]MCB2875620.1 hypothetical protein [Streptococcus suis]
MTEAILSLSIFAVPILAVGILEQRKLEKQRRKRELALIREMELINQFRHGMAYRDECLKQRVLNTERQQVDKEGERYARMVG